MDCAGFENLTWYACAPDVLEAGAEISKSGYLPCYALPRLECGDEGTDHLHGLPLMLAATLDQIRGELEIEEMRQREEIIASQKARMAESTCYPTMCIRHRRRLAWAPAPRWWYHADSLADQGDGPDRTCSAMLSKNAPAGLESAA